MQISADGVEYVHWTFTGVPDGASVPQVHLDGQWRDMTWVDSDGPERTARILVAGPLADTPGSAIVLDTGRTVTRVRLVDSPEVIVREGEGAIDVA